MKILFTLILLLSYGTLSAQESGWYKQNSGNNYYLFQIQFISKDTGYLSGNGSGVAFNLRTTNGGNVWSSFGPPNSGGYFFFLTTKIGWLNGNVNEKLYFTENGGETWEERDAPIGKFKFFNKDTGWAVGGENWCKTTDGGRKWRKLGPGFGNGDLSDLCIFDSEHMLGVGNINVPTPDGCASLVYDSAGISRRVPWCIYSGFIAVDNLNDSVVVTSGLLGIDRKPTVFISKTRGFSWEEISHPWAGVFGQGIDFSDDHNGTMVSVNGAITRTRDGGYTWEEQSSPTTDELLSVSFIDSLLGWSCGANGTIIHTTDAGKTWVKQQLPKPLTTSVSPEPFARKTSITYELPSAAKVKIHIYDILGKELEVLESPGVQDAGTHTIEFDGSRYPEGTFHYQIETDGFYGTGKMTKVVF